MLSTAPHHPGFRDVSKGSANLTYSTPSYVSMDQERNVTFFYSDSQNNPTLFVQLDATDNSGSPPTKMSITLKNGGTTVAGPIYYASGSGTTRLSIQQPTTLATGAYVFTAEVKSYSGVTEIGSSTDSVRVLVVNERSSPYGMGWSVVGLHRLYPTTGGVMIAEGDGTAYWFTDTGSGSYSTPDGDMSTVAAVSGSRWKRTYPDGTTYWFAPSSGGVAPLDSIVDRFGNKTTFAYNSSPLRLTTITDPVGKQITLSYTDYHLLDYVRDPLNRDVTTTKAWGVVVFQFITPDSVVDLDLDFAGANLAAYWTRGFSRSAVRWDFSYDSHGQVDSLIAPQVATTDAGTTRPTTTIRSLQAAVLPPIGTGSSGSPAPRVIPSNVELWSISPVGDTTKVQIDRYGNVVREVNAHGHVTQILRDQHGRDTLNIAPSGHQIRKEYSGPVLTKVQDLFTGHLTTYTYDSTKFHGLTGMYSGSTQLFARYLNVLGLPTTEMVLTPDGYGGYYGHSSYNTYDSKGRRLTSVDPEGHGTYQTYQSSNFSNTKDIKTGDSTTSNRRGTTYTYDGLGRVIQTKNTAGDSTMIRLNLMNQPERIRNALGDTVNYYYSQRGSLWKVRDPLGNVHTDSVDVLGRVVRSTDPAGFASYYHYDRNGRQTQVINRRGQSITISYDALGRSTQRIAGSDTTTWSYGSPTQPWVQISNSVSTDRFEMDIAGRVVRELTVRSPGDTIVKMMAYDTAGSRVSMQYYSTAAPSDTFEVAYVYDSARRLVAITDFSGNTSTLDYNGDGGLKSITYPGSVEMNLGYQASHAQVGMVFSGLVDGDTWDLGYTYDTRGLLSEKRPLSDDNNLMYWKYQYDRLGRLTREERWYAWESWCYENPDVGQICDDDNDWLGAQTIYSYDGMGNLTSTPVTTGNRLASGLGTFDADGNMTYLVRTGPDLSMSWNALNQLTSGGETFKYDGLGRLAVVSGTHFFWDGDDFFLEGDSAGQGGVIYTYRPGIDQPHAMQPDAHGLAPYYYVLDTPGNVVALFDSSGNVVNSYQYDAWGNVMSSNNWVDNRLLYGARPRFTPGYYHRNRWYDTGIRRYLSEDPIGLAGGLNLYTYANNSPTNLNDPVGLDPCGSVTQQQNAEAGKELPVCIDGVGIVGWIENTSDINWRRILDLIRQTLPTPIIDYGSSVQLELFGGPTGRGRPGGALSKSVTSSCGSASASEIRRILPSKGVIAQVADGLGSYIQGLAWGSTALAARFGLLGPEAQNQAMAANGRLGDLGGQLWSHRSQAAHAVGALATKYPLQGASRLGAGVGVSAMIGPAVGIPASVVAGYGTAFKASYQHPAAVLAATVVGASCP